MEDRNRRRVYSAGGTSSGYVNHRRKKKSLKAFYITLSIIAAAAAITVACTLLLKVSGVSVAGSSVYSSEEIIAACPIKPGDNLVTADAKAAKTAIEKALPYIKTAQVKKSFPSKITVTVEADEAFCAVSQAGVYVVCDKDSKVLEIKDSKPENIMVVDGIIFVAPEAGVAASFMNESSKASFEGVMSELFESGIDVSKITAMNFTDLADISFVYENRVEVKLGLPSDLSYKLTFCAKVLANADGSGINAQDCGILDLSRATNTDTGIFSKLDSLPSSDPAPDESGTDSTVSDASDTSSDESEDTSSDSSSET